MAWIYESFIVNSGDERVLMSHRFFGRTKDDCLATFNAHVSADPEFRAAVQEHRTYEEWTEIGQDELPVAEEEEDDGTLHGASR